MTRRHPALGSTPSGKRITAANITVAVTVAGGSTWVPAVVSGRGPAAASLAHSAWTVSPASAPSVCPCVWW